MRVAVWNMSHWERTGEDRAAAWGALRDLGADIALVQEAVPPDGLRSVVYREIGGGRTWGSAVCGLTRDVEAVTHATGRASKAPEPLLQTLPGSVAIAKVATDVGPVTFVSIYGVIENGYADTTVNRQLSDLAPLFDDPGLGRNLVMGGDLNITTQWIGKDARYRDWEMATFARINGFGLLDCMDLKRPEGPLAGCSCLDGERCRHIRTQYHPRSNRPWQNDYVFATQPLATTVGVTKADVVDEPQLRKLSGHLPLLVDFAFS